MRTVLNLFIPLAVLLLGLFLLVREFRAAAREGRPLRMRLVVYSGLAVAASALGTLLAVSLLLHPR